jgi:DNA-directed RNA polymerase specialized sigma24 family protein
MTASADAHIARLRPRWLGWLRLHRGRLADRHEDILQDAALDLAGFLAKNPGLPEDDVNRVGFTILRRRAADEYRQEVVDWAGSEVLDVLPSERPADNPEEVLDQARVLKTVAGMLAALDRRSRELLLREETAAGAIAPLSDAERKQRSRLRQGLKRRLLEEHGIDLASVFGAEVEQERRETADMTPLLQIIHVTDLHVKAGTANPATELQAKKRRALARVAQSLIQRFDILGWNEGTQGAYPKAADSFRRFLERWREKDAQEGQDWYGGSVARTWLVDTGDRTAYGDEASMKKGREYLEQWRAVLGGCEMLSLYGNHDAWPEVHPVQAVLGFMLDEIREQSAKVRAQPGWNYDRWLAAPLQIGIPGSSARIELYGLDSVQWSAVNSATAVGHLQADDIRKLRDVLRERQQAAPQARNFRIAAVHHPLVFPYKYFESHILVPFVSQMQLLDAADRAADLRNDANDPPGLGVLAHLFLSGHTHASYPADDIPPGTMGNQGDLTQHQLQLVGGSLMLNMSRKLASATAVGKSPVEIRENRKYNRAAIDWTSCQAQILRFYAHVGEPGKLTMIRVPVRSVDGSVYVEGLPTSVSFSFG